MIVPAHHSATERRELRRRIRNQLGPSSDPAPEARDALRVLTDAIRLLSLATDGELGAVFRDRHGNALTLAEMRARVSG